MEPFEYKPIVHEEHAFRIVRLCPGTGTSIKAEIIHASLEDSNLLEYEAVSYVWGSLELTDSIDVCGKNLKITNNLSLVIRDLRLPDQDRLLWIDGICIDQRLNKEKNHQVRQMDRIYRSAERVIFHLGRSSEHTPILNRSLAALRQQQQLEPEVPFEMSWYKVKDELAHQYNDFDAKIRRSVESILAEPWFQRIWIVQEVANARRALIHWGYAAFPVANFVHLVRQLGIEIEPQQTAILDMMPQKRRSESPWSSKQDLYHLLKRLKGAKASRDHDKIFALLGMCAHGKGHGTITVDYQKSEDLIIREVVAYMFFCEKDVCENICRTLKSVGDLLGSIETLLDDLVIYLAINTRLRDLQSLLSNRKDEIIITKKVLRPVLRDEVSGPEALRVLLAHRPDEIEAPFSEPEVLRILNSHKADRFEPSFDVVMHVLKQSIGRDNDNVLQSLGIRAERYMSFAFDWVKSFVPPPQELTPLWYALFNDNKDRIRQLLDEGDDVNAIAPEGFSALGWAAKEGKEDIASILLKHHADVEAGFPKPLSLAAEYGALKVAELLLSHGASVNCRDYRGRTPLSLAASGGYQAVLSTGDSLHGRQIIKSLIRESTFRSTIQRLQKQYIWLLNEKLSSKQREKVDPSNCSQFARSARDIGVYQARLSLDLLPDEDLWDDEDSQDLPQDFAICQIPEVYSDIIDLLLQMGTNVESRDLFGQTPLWWAVNYGHLLAVEKLLQNDANVHVMGDFGIAPLSWAIWNGHGLIAQKLLDSHTEVIVKDFGISLDRQEKTPLFWAIRTGSKSQVRQLLEEGLGITNATHFREALSENQFDIALLLLRQNPALASQVGMPRLSMAALTGEESIVEALLEQGADIEALYHGKTPLMLAVGGGRDRIVQRLLDVKANPNAVDYSNKTPLAVAVNLGFVDIVDVLLRGHVDINVMPRDGLSVLQQAAYKGHHKVARLLLNYGAVVEADVDVETPLLLTSCKGHVATARLLLEYGANVKAKNQDGVSALLLAADRGHWKTVRLLLKHGAEPEARIDFKTSLAREYSFGKDKQMPNFSISDYDGGTALLMATGHGHLKSVRLLLKHGANVDAQSNAGATPLIRACQCGHAAIVRLLLEHNANVRYKDSQGRSALDWSRHLRHGEIEQILEKLASKRNRGYEHQSSRSMSPHSEGPAWKKPRFVS